MIKILSINFFYWVSYYKFIAIHTMIVMLSSLFQNNLQKAVGFHNLLAFHKVHSSLLFGIVSVSLTNKCQLIILSHLMSNGYLF